MTSDIERINHSIVIARTQEGTLLRKIDALELLTIDKEMPIGAYAWQQHFDVVKRYETREIIEWRCTLDQGPYTFRHYDFALPVKVDYQSRGFLPGDFGSAEHFPRIGSFCELPYREYMYIIPRELVPADALENSASDVLWFFSSHQTPFDSVMYDAGTYLKDHSNFRPGFIDNGVPSTATYALCSHRTDMLTTWNGPRLLEKNKKVEIGKWYKCQYRPKIVEKCCNIVPYEDNPKPLEIFLSSFNDGTAEKSLILCRDFVEIPEFAQNFFCEWELVTFHPLLHKIFFPVSCAFSQTKAVEICFAREQFGTILENIWQVVAVGNGLGSMFWLPKLPPPLDDIIRKEDFPFIKSLSEAEAEHYSTFADNVSIDQINTERAKHFKAFCLANQNSEKEEKETVKESKHLTNNPNVTELY